MVKVNQPPQLLVYTVSGGLLYVCGSGCDNVTASVSGGTPPYTYLWSNHPSNNSNTQCISTSTYTPPTLGEKVYSQSNTQNLTFNIDLRSKSAGVYFYRILKDDGTIMGSGKMVIQK